MATFNYVDNLAYAVRYTYEILVDMIPRVYDTPRAVRVLGEDGGENGNSSIKKSRTP
uniref:portal protein n=1 Tax=Xylella fastidiosa TaxID=2371 RepID=UPI00234CE472|nr:portal protein [Xylella fastidiosa]